MALTTIDELFGGPWGIVESRRQEIESGSFGAFDRIYKEEVARNFIPISKVAGLLDCHESTARKAMQGGNARYVTEGQSHLYFKPDVDSAQQQRAEAKRVTSLKKVKP
jgi:hypothetical protein